MMNDPRRPEQGMPASRAGLCAGCVHARVIVNDRGSQFLRCEYSAVDSRYPRYPALPVRRCAAVTPPPDPSHER
jgi:hypothetical protein